MDERTEETKRQRQTKGECVEQVREGNSLALMSTSRDRVNQAKLDGNKYLYALIDTSQDVKFNIISINYCSTCFLNN